MDDGDSRLVAVSSGQILYSEYNIFGQFIYALPFPLTPLGVLHYLVVAPLFVCFFMLRMSHSNRQCFYIISNYTHSP